jgi:hypothetical protein
VLIGGSCALWPRLVQPTRSTQTNTLRPYRFRRLRPAP